MGDVTKIAWTDRTFNPWMGCTKVSAGCTHCYAETLTTVRMGLRVWGPRAQRQVTKSPWQNVRKWDREARAGAVGADGQRGRLLVFTGSLMDVFEDRPEVEAARRDMWDLIRSSPGLHFQLLTKRPENIRRFLPASWGEGWPNVWLGTSIEDMRVAVRADVLREIPAVVRFISFEPALGPLDDLDLTGIDWLIYGGESGPGFRPEGTPGNPKVWARRMRARCRAAGVAFFHKQSSAPRTEMGIELDGEIVREFPAPRGALRELSEEDKLADFSAFLASAAA